MCEKEEFEFANDLVESDTVCISAFRQNRADKDQRKLPRDK